MTLNSSSTCQSYVDPVTWHSTVTALSATYTIFIYLVYTLRLKDRWAESNPKAAARFWFIAVVPKFCTAVALFTILMPTCTAACRCDDNSPLYVYPSISMVLCAVWVARGMALLKRARTQENGGAARVVVAQSTMVLDDEDYDRQEIQHARVLKPSTTDSRPVPSEAEMV